MKKIIDFLKRNVAIHMVVGAWLGVMGAVYVIYSNAEVSSGLNASSVNIDTTNMPLVGENKKLDEVLDYLYEKASHVGEEGCPEGYEYMEYDNVNGYSCFQPGLTVEWATDKTYLGIAYLDPTNLYATCNAVLASQNLNNKSPRTPTEVKYGCMKWYIYGTDENDDYLAILDHNTTAAVQWNTNQTNVYFSSSLAYPYLTELTNPVSQGGYGWLLPTRIISGQEIANLANISSWKQNSSSSTFYLDGTNQSGVGTSSYVWLYDYTYQCTSYGCNYDDNNIYNPANNTSYTAYSYGYWTSTPKGTVNSGTSIWGFEYVDALVGVNTSHTYFGLRPVITIDKDLIET